MGSHGYLLSPLSASLFRYFVIFNSYLKFKAHFFLWTQ